MKPKIVGIAGGSGSGKSTVCYKLIDDNPGIFEVINLDDYQKKKTDPNLPMIDGKINWDHPGIIDWDKLIADLNKLRSGQSITIDVWSHRSNPDYAKHGEMLPRTISPKPVILLEGYLALYNPELDKIYARKYYFELDDKTRNLRRGKNEVINDPEYEQKVLIPMHKQFVEPTKANADLVIDVSNLSVNEVVNKIYADITRLGWI
jgi:uridine kinase